MSHFLEIPRDRRRGHISHFDLELSKLYLKNMQRHISVTLEKNDSITIGIFNEEGKEYILELLRLALVALQAKHKSRLYEKVDYLLHRSDTRKWYQFWRRTTFEQALKDARLDSSWISGSDLGYMDEVFYSHSLTELKKFKEHVEMSTLLEYDNSVKYTLKQLRFQEFLHFLNPNSILTEEYL